MKKIIAVAIIPLALAACGVKKELYQAEVLRAGEAEAQGEDLKARLSDSNQKIASLEEENKALLERKGVLERELSSSKAAADEGGKALLGCNDEKEQLMAELDAAKRTILDGDRKSKELGAEIKRLAAKSEADAKACDARVESVQALMEKARGRITSMEAERSVLLEEKDKLERENVEKVEELSQNYEVLLNNMREEQEKLKKEKESKLNELSSAYEGLLKDMKSQIESGQITISNLKGRLTVNMMDEILFPSGSAVVKEDGKKLLKQVGEALKDIQDKAIIIEGHTDNVPIGGALTAKFPTNWELSTARAVAVVRFLSESAGVSPAKLSAVGYGENRPAAPNDTPAGKAKNRRIEIKLVPVDTDILPKPEASQGTESSPAGGQPPAQEASQPQAMPAPAVEAKAQEAVPPQSGETKPQESAPAPQEATQQPQGASGTAEAKAVEEIPPPPAIEKALPEGGAQPASPDAGNKAEPRP